MKRVDRSQKILSKLRNSPHNVTFSDIRRLLEEAGFQLTRITGSHHIFQKDDVIFPIPVHRNRVKVVYVKRVIELIDSNE